MVVSMCKNNLINPFPLTVYLLIKFDIFVVFKGQNYCHINRIDLLQVQFEFFFRDLTTCFFITKEIIVKVLYVNHPISLVRVNPVSYKDFLMIRIRNYCKIFQKTKPGEKSIIMNSLTQNRCIPTAILS